jgi:hypothetical protein
VAFADDLGRASLRLNDSPRPPRLFKLSRIAHIGTASRTITNLGLQSRTRAPTDRSNVHAALPAADSSGLINYKTIFASPTAPKRSSHQTSSSRTAAHRTTSLIICASIMTVERFNHRRAVSVDGKVITRVQTFLNPNRVNDVLKPVEY